MSTDTASAQRGGPFLPTRCDFSSFHATARATNTRTRTISSNRATRPRRLTGLCLRQVDRVNHQLRTGMERRRADSRMAEKAPLSELKNAHRSAPGFASATFEPRGGMEDASQSRNVALNATFCPAFCLHQGARRCPPTAHLLRRW
jgi:hypothetical protein